MLHFDNSPLMIGVAGDTDLETDASELKERVRTLFRFLRSSDKAAERKRRLEALVELLPSHSRSFPNPYRLGLGNWPALKETPILIFTALAPGADSLVAEVALEDEFVEQNFHVIAPLPFPHDRYTTSNGGTASEPVAARRVDAYERLLPRVGRHRTFCVRTQEGAERTEKDSIYAAGEYIASHVHLLIAIWDDQSEADTAADAAAIVHARRHGHRIGMLPASTGLSQPHGGPIFHLPTRFERNPASTGPRKPLARFLHPVALTPESTSEREELKYQHVGLALFTRIARNLEQFNNTACPGTPEADGELNRQLSWRPGTSQSLSGESQPKKQFSHVLLIKYQTSGLYDSYRKLAVLRRRGADQVRRLNDLSSSTLRIMFVVALLAALLTHLFSEWHLPEEASAHAPVVRPWLGLAGVLLGFLGIAWFWLRGTQHHDNRAHDYRALAEGARVQLFWNLAGLGESVPANYMQRQRGELDWIRGAIRAASIPYERWRDRFHQLERPDQVAAIRCVLQNWVQEQAKYFATVAKRHHHRLHYWHKLGGLLAIAGLLGFLLLALSSLSSPERPLDWLEEHPIRGLIPAGVLAVACFPISLFRLPLLDRTHATSLDPYPSDPKRPNEFVLQRFNWLLHRAVPTTDRHTWQSHTRSEERLNLLLNFVCFLVPASALALLTATAGALAAKWIPHAPEDASIWTSVLLGGLLLAGALCVAWSEKHLDSELAYQYSTMAPMFRTAQTRLEPLVEKLEAATCSGDDAAFSEALEKIRMILYDIGIEALDENAEWLIMHRARPLEPVMAG